MKLKSILFYLALAGLAVFFYLRYRVAPAIELDSITVETKDLSTLPLSQLATGAQMVHFYASWCGPCMKELPGLAQFSKTSNIPLTLVTDDSWAKINPVAEKYNLNIVRVSSLKETEVYTIPVTYFVGKDGTIKKKKLGECPWEDPTFINEINTLLD
jgi:thiol-disulfide isomerase/thioredoxin